MAETEERLDVLTQTGQKTGISKSRQALTFLFTSIIQSNQSELQFAILQCDASEIHSSIMQSLRVPFFFLA